MTWPEAVTAVASMATVVLVIWVALRHGGLA